ncbi:hypothetical protein MTR67_052009 [Solanum verrucosum]|uniref:Uncharacterized protein n=1 Tax=Solanum verrucosum TaxID=315347 RepID=A0AAF1A373_SOLVR|nr:hypothetical protein MTR67_052009 [Solanum verrucosum]
MHEEGEQYRDAKEAARRLPPRKEVDHKTELEGIRKTLKELHEGLDRVNGLLIAQAQDSNAYTMAMQHGCCINRWGKVSRPATSQFKFGTGIREKILELWGVRTESSPVFFWVSVDGLAHIMSINASPSLSPDEDIHFQDLPLVLFPDAPSEREDEAHTSFQMTLDGFASWSSVSRNPFLPMSTDSFMMPHDVVPVPRNVDDNDEIPFAQKNSF